MSAEKSLSKAIKHYQNSLEKYSENRNELKLLHYISRLQELPVQVHHLEETGVGRTVNGLRKLGGDVSEAAKSLVAKWKQMVLAQHEQEEEENEPNDDDDDDDEDDDNDNDNETDRMIIDTNEDVQEDNQHDSNYYKIKDADEEMDDHGEQEQIDEQKSKEHDKKSREESHKLEKSHKSHKHKHKEKDNSKHHHHHHNHHKEHSDKGSTSRTKSDKSSNHKHDKDRSESREKKRHKSSKSDNHSSSSSSKKIEDKSRKDERPHHRTSSEKRHSDNKPKSKREDMAKSTNGIDSASGASFAEALGMCEPSSSKVPTKRKLTPDKTNNSVVKEKTVKLTEVPPKPNEETPHDLDISSLLPPITPNYRPLGNLTLADISTKKSINEFDDLSTIITSKNQRTKVYSGNKTFYNKVPTLFELCVRILQDNIDALEYTGGVPYLILKPILEKATPTQLFSLEHHNPYLVEDTDELWQLHCQKNFRNKQPEEFESWREMYMRCLDEREAKLKALTANIKQAQDKSTPIRTTKLAYVDDVVKPPRNILKKQAKNAILDKTPTITPSARLNSLATAGEAGKIVVPNPGSRAAERSTSNHTTNNKPKKAPLMMKSLSLLKNRFRR